ncbi:MAG: hypothetical protein K2W88_05090, partial [Pararheinheimera sp.]|nr:hypothetical protein [Rheinheimera sp.]
MKSKLRLHTLLMVVSAGLLMSCQHLPTEQATEQKSDQGKSWLAGDHHVHSHYSVKWDSSVFPPAPILGGDAKYSIP